MIRIMLILTTISISGCGLPSYQVVCDSGWVSPVTPAAEIHAGLIGWKQGGAVKIRRMLEGEICSVVRVKT